MPKPVINQWLDFVDDFIETKPQVKTYDRFGLPQRTFTLRVSNLSENFFVGYDWTWIVYTKRKLTQLKGHYFNQDKWDEFLDKVEYRESLGHPHSTSFYFDSGKPKNTHNAGVQTMGRCLQTLNLIMAPSWGSQCFVDVNLRASEISRALLADIKFICEFLLTDLHCIHDKEVIVRFNIGWAVLDPGSMMTYLLSQEKMVTALDRIKRNNTPVYKNLKTVLNRILSGKEVSYDKSRRMGEFFLDRISQGERRAVERFIK